MESCLRVHIVSTDQPQACKDRILASTYLSVFLKVSRYTGVPPRINVVLDPLGDVVEWFGDCAGGGDVGDRRGVGFPGVSRDIEGGRYYDHGEADCVEEEGHGCDRLVAGWSDRLWYCSVEVGL